MGARPLPAPCAPLRDDDPRRSCVLRPASGPAAHPRDRTTRDRRRCGRRDGRSHRAAGAPISGSTAHRDRRFASDAGAPAGRRGPTRATCGGRCLRAAAAQRHRRPRARPQRAVRCPRAATGGRALRDGGGRPQQRRDSVMVDAEVEAAPGRPVHRLAVHPGTPGSGRDRLDLPQDARRRSLGAWAGYSSGAITMETMAISFSRILSEGPAVSLNGSPTVSPTTAALCGSEPFPPR